MYNPKTCVRLMTNVREFPIGSPWHSIWRPAGLSSNVITTEPCRNPDVDPILTFRKWTWIIYIYDVLSIKTILFDILDFWYQLEKIRFVKTLSKHRMFVSFMKILACWLLHRLIKLNKFVEKRDLPNYGQTCGHYFGDVIWRIPNPTLISSKPYKLEKAPDTNCKQIQPQLRGCSRRPKYQYCSKQGARALCYQGKFRLNRGGVNCKGRD